MVDNNRMTIYNKKKNNFLLEKENTNNTQLHRDNGGRKRPLSPTLRLARHYVVNRSARDGRNKHAGRRCVVGALKSQGDARASAPRARGRGQSEPDVNKGPSTPVFAAALEHYSAAGRHMQ